VGAQGFEPRPAGIFCSATVLLCVRLVAGNSRVGLPVDHHLSEHTTRHSRATGASYTTRLYYTPLVNHKQNHCLAWRRARFLRRSFFLRHFHRCWPAFFQAREPRFMVNSSATNNPYMRTPPK